LQCTLLLLLLPSFDPTLTLLLGAVAASCYVCLAAVFGF
jgi:hypothetical protein